MNKLFFTCILGFLLFKVDISHSQTQISEADEHGIMTVFEDQQDAWNNGDLDEFMEGYWKSDQLVFVGGSGPTYGWVATLENYKKAYPDRSAMGTLEFEVLQLQQIDISTARLIGKFHLSRSAGDLNGYFTLIWKDFNGKWRIISDHTSSGN